MIPRPEWVAIPGWFDWISGVDEAVAHFNSGVFVEVGNYVGRSLIYTADAVKRSGKSIRVVGVDTCRGSGCENGNDNHRQMISQGGGTLAGILHKNVIDCGVADYVDLIVSDSVRAAGYFADNSLEMVFLDAAHDEESVAADIAAWLPKVRRGGWLCGDDLCPIWPGVEKAVAAALPGYTKWSWDSWRYIKPNMEPQ